MNKRKLGRAMFLTPFFLLILSILFRILYDSQDFLTFYLGNWLMPILEIISTLGIYIAIILFYTSPLLLGLGLYLMIRYRDRYKINRFYKKIPGSRDKSKIDKDFDLIEKTMEDLYGDVKAKDVQLVNEPLEAAFRSRVGIVLYQNKLRAYHLLRGIVGEMNNNNVPAVIPLVRTFLELSIQLGYILRQMDVHEYEHLLKEPLMKLLLGNKNEKAGPFAIGTVESVNILTMISHADKAIVELGGNSGHLEAVYADLSNQSHPNYMSNMLYSTIFDDGIYKTLKDIGEDMESLKGLAYPFYVDPLITSIAFYQVFLGGIYNHEKMSD